MNGRLDHYWQDLDSRGRLTRAVVISVVIHIVGVSVVFANFSRAWVMPPTYQVRFIPYPKGEPQKNANTSEPETKKADTPKKAEAPKQEAKPEPKPEPEKPKPEPEKPKPEPKPEKPKPEPEKPKPEKPKPEKPKPEPKPKTEAKPDSKASEGSSIKTASKANDRPSPKSARDATPGSKAGSRTGNDAFMNENAPMKDGINLPEGTPSVLDGWARLVQMKVEKNWIMPEGLRLDASGNQAVVSFWVDRQGNLLEQPKVVKPASDPALGESGVQAILNAVPLPPLPDDFKALEQEVLYGFTLAE